jgi:hypothetical protein
MINEFFSRSGDDVLCFGVQSFSFGIGVFGNGVQSFSFGIGVFGIGVQSFSFGIGVFGIGVQSFSFGNGVQRFRGEVLQTCFNSNSYIYAINSLKGPKAEALDSKRTQS